MKILRTQLNIRHQIENEICFHLRGFGFKDCGAKLWFSLREEISRHALGKGLGGVKVQISNQVRKEINNES